MFDIIISNYLLWVNILIPIVIGVYLVLTHKDYVLPEFFAQAALTVFVLFFMFFIGYRVQDVYTTSYNNGMVFNFVFEEEWTELVHYQESYSCGTSKNPQTCYRTRTREDYHPDEYYIRHSFGSTYIPKSSWDIAINKFGYKITDTSHSGQISHGDGRTFESVPNIIIPMVSEQEGINYLYAAKTNIIKSKKLKELEKLYKHELSAYPKPYVDIFGNVTINRVINNHLISPVAASVINKEMSVYASINGKKKEVNPLVYITSVEDRAIVEVIKGHYADAHKNDAVLIVSVDKSGDVRWTDSFGLTKNTEFFVSNRGIGRESNINLKTNTNTTILTNAFKNNITKYWKRIPMEEFNYLRGDIDLPLWYEIFIVMINIIGSAVLFYIMIQRVDLR